MNLLLISAYIAGTVSVQVPIQQLRIKGRGLLHFQLIEGLEIVFRVRFTERSLKLKTASGFFFVAKSLLKRTINFLTDHRLHSQSEIHKRPMLVTMKETTRGLFDSRCWLIIAEYGTASRQPARGSEELGRSEIQQGTGASFQIDTAT